MKKQLLILLLLTITNLSFGATYRMNVKYIGLEGKKVPIEWKALQSNIRMDKSRYKLGKRSLQWHYKDSDAKLIFTAPETITQALKEFKGGMMAWVYNDQPQDDSIKIEFRHNNESKLYFYYHLNFKGWRACWIRFKEDMSGDKNCNQLDQMVIHRPQNNSKGTLWFDRISFPSRRIHDRTTPDQQLPWINPKMNHNHWAALYHWESTYKKDIKQNKPLTFAQSEELNTIYHRTLKFCKGKKPTAIQLQRALDKMSEWRIRKSKDSYKGTPFVSFDESSKDEIIIKDAGKILSIFANDYYYNKNRASAQNFELLISYLIDQGLAYGSGIGTNHHYGYQFTEYPKAIFLMSEYLTKQGKIEEVSKMLRYWTGLQEMRIKPKVGTLQGVVDRWNTTITPRIIAAGTLKDHKERYVAYKMIARWMDQSLRITPGTMGGIKEDGTMFHHGGNYPAYAVGGLGGISEYLKMMSNTEFQLDNHSLKNIGLVLDHLFRATSKNTWGFGISGRHPLKGNINNNTLNLYGQLALLHNPYHPSEKYWKEMGRIYLTIETKNTELKKKIIKAGIKPYKYDNKVFYSYNFNALATVKKEKWQATIKGYNKNVWGSEIYTKDNRFGRYQSYGTVQIMSDTQINSGYSENGWDWNRYPGSTNIHLPLKKLNSPNKNTLMERSPEDFAGSAHLNNEIGVFGMILQENNRPNFTPSFRAMKSVFYFDSMILCLGNNIQNDNKEYETETTIFQLKKRDDFTTISNKTLQNGRLQKIEWVKDAYNNGYIFPKETNLFYEDKEQTSKHNKTKRTTKGRFCSIVIKHGYAPKNESYEYIIVPQTNETSLKEISRKIRNNQSPYKIITNDSTASVINIIKDHTYMYAFYHHGEIKEGPISSASKETLVIFKENKQSALLVVTDPSVHIPAEKNIIASKSQKSEKSVTIKGKWKVAKDDQKVVKNCITKQNQTTITVDCWKGRNNTLQLIKNM